MIKKTRAIILHTIKYGESSLVVQAFTREWGRMSFLLKGARKTKKGNKSSLFQPLFLLDLDVYFKDGREMQWIKEATYVGAPPVFAGNIVKSTQAIFICELLSHTLQESEKNEALYGFLFNSIGVFNNPEFDSSSFHLIFMFKLMKYLGHFPQNNFSKESCYFDPGSGGFSPVAFGSDPAVEAKLGRTWYACFQAEYNTGDQLFMNQKSRNDFLDSLIDFYQIHYSQFGTLKSLDVLRSVFEE